MDYRAYLKKIVALTKKVRKPETQSSYPVSINSPARRALYDNLKDVEDLAGLVIKRDVIADSPDMTEFIAHDVDRAIRNVKKADWRGNRFKEREVRIAIRSGEKITSRAYPSLQSLAGCRV